MAHFQIFVPIKVRFFKLPPNSNDINGYLLIVRYYPSRTKWNPFIVIENEQKDFYYQIYKAAKFTTDELREYKVCENTTEAELEKLSDLLFDLGLLAQKIMIENND